MKKFLILLCAISLLCGCIEKGVELKQTDNPNYKVEFLFEVDGVKVYRFNDGGHYVYFTNGSGMTKYEYTRRRGKTSKRYYVQTLCNSYNNE